MESSFLTMNILSKRKLNFLYGNPAFISLLTIFELVAKRFVSILDAFYFNLIIKAHRNLNSEQKQGSRAKDELARGKQKRKTKSIISSISLIIHSFISLVCANFKVFLEEASAFFHGLIAKFESTYKLNLQHPNFQGMTEIKKKMLTD